MNGTPERDDGIRITEETEASDLREFTKRRATEPIELDDGVVVWNFSTHEVDREALALVAPALQQDRYIIPYQVPGAWGYIQTLLPEEIRRAELLVYSIRDSRYKAFPNFSRESKAEADAALRGSIESWHDSWVEDDG